MYKFGSVAWGRGARGLTLGDKCRVSLYSVDGLEKHPCSGVCIEIPPTLEQVRSACAAASRPSHIRMVHGVLSCSCSVACSLGSTPSAVTTRTCAQANGVPHCACAWAGGRVGKWTGGWCGLCAYLRAGARIGVALLPTVRRRCCSWGGRIDDIDTVQIGEALFLSAGTLGAWGFGSRRLGECDHRGPRCR
jgi:hypothetical protein